MARDELHVMANGKVPFSILRLEAYVKKELF